MQFKTAFQVILRLSALIPFVACSSADPFAIAREKMVREQIEARGVRRPEVLRVMRATPRHLFVPGNVRSMAYEDHPLPLAQGQTISQPYIVAAMTELLEPSRTHKVLEIGTGSGYQAAVLSPLVKELFTIEIVRELAESSRILLQQLAYRNVAVRHGNGYLGWPEQAPFDRIILTAAPPELPKTLTDQLRNGGKLVAPVGEGPFSQELIVVDKDAKGNLKRRSVFPVRFVPMVK
ncbi:MAG: protein-L-isoaspartate(D-aspartate) O-methyltransferase [Bryobacteraceae bacterium]